MVTNNPKNRKWLQLTKQIKNDNEQPKINEKQLQKNQSNGKCLSVAKKMKDCYQLSKI